MNSAKYCLFFSQNGMVTGVRRVEQSEGCQIKLDSPPPDDTAQGTQMVQIQCSLN